MTYRIEYGRTAAKQFRKIAQSNRVLARRIRAAIDALATDPRPSGCLQLAGHPGLWRIRVGDWRIVYAIEDGVLVVYVVLIAKRDEVYRNLPDVSTITAVLAALDQT